MSKITTINSTIKGKAYEYACILALKQLVENIRPIKIIENSSLEIAKKRYLEDISQDERSEMIVSAMAGMKIIIKIEPKIIEDGNDLLTISLQPDTVAKSGDIRDILIIRRSIEWEIGVSVKHNHEALKHSRLAQNLDFGSSWYGLRSSQKYFDEITPIFNNLTKLKVEGRLWRDIEDKNNIVYVPLLKAFIKEIIRAYKLEGDKVTTGLIKYLLGSNGNDYYKLIHYKNHLTRVIPYNLYGTLNKATETSEPEKLVPKILLPTRIIDLSFKENSLTTVILTMDNGWSLSFRLHNASSRVEPSLKFDIQLVGQPSSLFYIDVDW